MPSVLRKVLRKASRPAVWAYYAALYGRRLPGAVTLEAWMRRLEALGERGDVPVGQQAWEEQYRAGRWAGLRAADEVARYGVLVGFLEQLASPRTILDVGCGEGILRDLLGAGRYLRYEGIDLSAAAIETARRGAGESDRLLVADAETYVPEAAFDAVVLNESLYYLADPRGQAWRYLGFVRPGGLLLVSMFHSVRTAAILRALAAELPLVDRVRVSGRKGSWAIAVFRG